RAHFNQQNKKVNLCTGSFVLFFFSFLVLVSFVQVKEAKELKMAKITYTSVFFVVLLLSIPSILNAETSVDANSIAPSDFLTETTYQVLSERKTSLEANSWYDWIFDFMGGVDMRDEAAQPESAEAPAFAPSSWTLRHL
ncbi:hypothetical protein Tsubulata_045968, partial [Turnera subulata]